jgi:hypothetical protein
MWAHSRSSGICLVCVAVLTLLGCGGGGDPTNEPVPVPLTIAASTAATESGSGGSSFRSEHFTFAIPAGWAELPGSSTESWGQVASAASFAPKGIAPSSVVVVVSYDVSGLPSETADGPRAWFDWYTKTNDAEVGQAPSEIEFDGDTAWQGSLKWIDRAGNPVEVRIVRVVRGDLLYLIQCQAEPADRASIAAGCETILTSFRAT